MICTADVRVGNFGEETTDDFELVFKKQWPILVRILYRMTRDHGLSEDLAQETLFRFHEKGHRLEKPEAWIYRVAIRLGLDSLKSRSRRTWRERFGTGEAASPPRPDSQLERAERHKLIQQILREMPRRSVLLLILHYSGFSYGEIGEACALAVTSVGTLLNRAELDFKKRYLKMTGGAKP